jgi:dTDP-4-amino-4,6-dideoxygalactose transaminase
LKPIPLLSLKVQYRGLARELRRAAARVLDSGAYILGPEGKAFEAEFAAAQKVPEAVGVSSGTAALELSLKALGLGPGDEVVVPAYTFIATATAVSAVGAVPVFADVDDESLTLSRETAEAALSKRAKALLPVHIFGGPADMDSLNALARARGLKVLEDCAQAHMALYRGKAVGALGDIAAFSFYPSKNLGAAGDAGAITTADPRLAETCRTLRHVGRSAGSTYKHELIGFNARMDELQAAVLRVKLKRLPEWTRKRRRVAALYQEGLAGLPLRLPALGADGSRHCFHLYVMRLERRDELARHLAASGIGAAVYYPIPLHLQPAYAALKYKAGDFPVAERACKEALALPMYPELTDGEVERVCRAVRAFF